MVLKLLLRVRRLVKILHSGLRLPLIDVDQDVSAKTLHRYEGYNCMSYIDRLCLMYHK